MSKSIVIIVLFVAAQVVAFCGALLVENAGALAGADVPLTAGDDSLALTVRPATLGVAQLVADVVLVGLLLLVGLVRRRFFTAGRRAGAGPGVLAVAGVLLAAFGLDLVLQPLALPDGGQMDLFLEMTRSVPCVVLLCLVGPLVEELVFREGLLRHLAAAGLHPLVACGVSALVFGVVHANWAQAVPAALLGFVLGLLYLRTGDLRLSLPAHVLNNALAVLLLRWPDAASWSDGLAATSLLLAGGALLVLGTAAVITVLRRHTDFKETLRV